MALKLGLLSRQFGNTLKCEVYSHWGQFIQVAVILGLFLFAKLCKCLLHRLYRNHRTAVGDSRAKLTTKLTQNSSPCCLEKGLRKWERNVRCCCSLLHSYQLNWHHQSNLFIVIYASVNTKNADVPCLSWNVSTNVNQLKHAPIGLLVHQQKECANSSTLRVCPVITCSYKT